jgi:hypothetical protein
MTSRLKILQYNVQTTLGKVMAPLLADPRISEFSVLAVQELWRNPRILTTHDPFNTSFHLIYPPSAEALVCFSVNKLSNPSSYSACFLTPKYSYLRLRRPVEGVQDVMIYNVYRTQNLFPPSFENQPLDELLSLDTHENFLLFLLLFLMPLPTMYYLRTSTSTTPTGEAPELHPIVLFSCFCPIKSCTTSPYFYPLRA